MNIVGLLGRLTADPEIKHTPNDVAVTSFNIAVNRAYKDKDGNYPADFITIVAWRNTAEFVCKHFQKGQMIAVQGAIQTRSYIDKDGNKRKAFEIVADNVHFAESKRNNANVNVQKTEQESTYAGQDQGTFEEILSDDDLPFS